MHKPRRPPRTHVLLDLDGTLTDSSPGISRSLQHAFAVCGYAPPSAEVIRTMIGPPFEITFPRLGVPVADIERVIDAYRERYEDVGLFENGLYDGVVEMVDALAERHIVALATAKPEPTAIRIVEHFGLTDRFAVQAGASFEVGSGKRTKGEVITNALARLGIGHGPHVVMVGDRDHDVEGAHLNEIDCIGVTWGFGSRDELREAGALVVVDTPAEVVDAVHASYRSAHR